MAGEDGVDGEVGDDPDHQEEPEGAAEHPEPDQAIVDAIFEEIFMEDPDFICDPTEIKRHRSAETDETRAGTTDPEGTVSDPEIMKFSDGEFEAPPQEQIIRPVTVPRRREIKASQK